MMEIQEQANHVPQNPVITIQTEKNVTKLTPMKIKINQMMMTIHPIELNQIIGVITLVKTE